MFEILVLATVSLDVPMSKVGLFCR